MPVAQQNLQSTRTLDMDSSALILIGEHGIHSITNRHQTTKIPRWQKCLLWKDPNGQNLRGFVEQAEVGWTKAFQPLPQIIPIAFALEDLGVDSTVTFGPRLHIEVLQFAGSGRAL
jgi:hypothetical protein